MSPPWPCCVPRSWWRSRGSLEAGRAGPLRGCPSRSYGSAGRSRARSGRNAGSKAMPDRSGTPREPSSVRASPRPGRPPRRSSRRESRSRQSACWPIRICRRRRSEAGSGSPSRPTSSSSSDARPASPPECSGGTPEARRELRGCESLRRALEEHRPAEVRPTEVTPGALDVSGRTDRRRRSRGRGEARG